MDQNSNMEFTDKGGTNYPNPDTETTQCTKFPSVDLLSLNSIDPSKTNLMVTIMVKKKNETHQRSGVKE